MVAATQLVLNCVGPFRFFGEVVVKVGPPVDDTCESAVLHKEEYGRDCGCANRNKEEAHELKRGAPPRRLGGDGFGFELKT